MRNSVKILGDIVSPVIDLDELEALRDRIFCSTRTSGFGSFRVLSSSVAVRKTRPATKASELWVSPVSTLGRAAARP